MDFLGEHERRFREIEARLQKLENGSNVTLEVGDLEKSDYCFLEAIKAALSQRGNYAPEDTERLQELKALFENRIALSKK